MLGLLLLVAAISLTAYNLYDGHRAEASARQAVHQLETRIPIPSEEAAVPVESPQASSKTEAAPRETPEALEEVEIPDYVLNPEMEMPVITVDGVDYVGILSIPALALELPVISRWSYANLKLAPCRYSGSAYLGDLVIAAHNYPAYFRDLKQLAQGDTVTFTDADGNVFSYQVADMETLAPTETENMISGDYDLTLFTCTVCGQSRVAVRCDLITEK